MSTPAVPDDVFLSHSSPDKSVVERLARRLLDAGIRPWLDSWNLIPGDPWQEGLEAALDTCTTCAVFLGPSGIGPWHNEELRVALDRRARDPTRTFRVIPVLLPGANPADPNTLPRFLSRMTWVDFRAGLDDANAFNRLLAGIRGVAPGPGLSSPTGSAGQANPVAPSPPTGALTAGQRQRLSDEYTRLQTQYDTYTRRLAALDTDIGRTLGSLEKQVLEERRAELYNEREAVMQAMAQIERRLAEPGTRPAGYPKSNLPSDEQRLHEHGADMENGGRTESVASSSEVMPPPVRKQLPDVAGFVGRDTELGYYLKKLKTSGMAVITGMPGVGKTALASMLARQVATPDNIFWHSFHENEGVDAIIWDLAGFFALHGQDKPWRILQSAHQPGGRLPPREILFDYLLQPVRGHEYVLCLDNFQFVDNDPFLGQLVELTQSAVLTGQLALIIVSRHVPVFVRPNGSSPLTGLTSDDVKILLHSRGLLLGDELLNALYEHTQGNAEFLVLAIEVLKHSSDPAHLIRNLEKNDDIDGFLRDEVHKRLTQPEQAVMGAISILLGFPGTRGAIEAVLGRGNIKLLLRQLVDRHLVMRIGEQTAWRYSQHAIVQAFYYELLSDTKRDQMHLRAGRYFEDKEPNMLQAALHFERGRDTGRATELATAHVSAIINQGQARQLQLLLERLSHELLALPEGPERSALRAKYYVGMADLLEYSAPARAVEWIEQCLCDGGDEHSQVTAALYVKLCGAHFNLSNYALAQEAAERAQQILGDTPSHLLVHTLINLSNLSAVRGDLIQASMYTKQSLAMSQSLGDQEGALTALGNSGVDKFMAGDTAGAIVDLQEALTLAQKLDSVRDEARLQVNLGIAYVRTGADELASAALDKGVELARQCRAVEYVIAGLLGQAELQLRRSELVRAGSILVEAEAMAQQMQAWDLLAETWRRWAELDLVLSDLPAARGHIQQALDAAQRLMLKAEEGTCLRIKGQVLWAVGDRDGALTAFALSLGLLEDCDAYEAACTRMAWGSALMSTCSPQDGRVLLQEARAVFEATGAQPRLAAIAEAMDEREKDHHAK